jgi:hypothetical protein
MWVKFNWGDGTAVLNTGYNISGFNVSAEHTYTSRGQKTISCIITDEFGATTTIYKVILIEDVPDSPANIQSSAYNQQIRVNWNKPVDDGGKPVLTYNIKWWNASLSEATATFIYEIPYTNASEYSGTGHYINGLTNGITYDYRVGCNNTYGQGAWSSIYDNEPGHTSPSTPALQPLSQYSGQVLDLSWSEPVFYDGAVVDEYYVLVSVNNTIYVALDSTVQRTYHATGLVNGVTYYFKVYVTDDQSAQSQNSSYQFTTIDDVNPSTPILADLSAYTYSDQVNLTWSASTDTVSGVSYYIIEEDIRTSFSNPTNTYEGPALSTSFSSNHDYGRTYYYRVRAVDGAGNPSLWNGPIQTMLKTNETTLGDYSIIKEIWFCTNSIVINQPLFVVVTVENRYSIPAGNVNFVVNSVETEMRVSAVTTESYKFSGTWTPTMSGNIDFEIRVVNSNNAVNSVIIPVNVVTSASTHNISTVKVFDSGGDIIVATFSEGEYNVSSYKDALNTYHVTFGEQPDAEVVIDLTDLEPTFVAGELWFIPLSWLDSRQLNCAVHGDRRIVYYKVDADYTITGYNDWTARYLGWLLGKSFELVEATGTYITVSSIEKTITCKL